MYRSLIFLSVIIHVFAYTSCRKDVKQQAKVTSFKILKSDNPHLSKDYEGKIQDFNIKIDASKELFKKNIIAHIRYIGDTIFPPSKTPLNLNKKISFSIISDSLSPNKGTINEYKLYFNTTRQKKIFRKRTRQKDQTNISSPLIVAYFPSWREYTPSPNSKLREIPAWINHVFLAFVKPEMRYKRGTLDLRKTGLQLHYPRAMAGKMLQNSIKILHKRGIKVLLSIGGGTYCSNLSLNKIRFNEIKALVDDMGFDGIDWDIEPNGSFYSVGSKKNVQLYVDIIKKSRRYFPQKKYIVACAPAGVGALGGIHHNDPVSPFAYEKRNLRCKEPDIFLKKNTYNNHLNKRISFYGFKSTGHMIPVFKKVGYLIDIVAYQGYNIGTASDRHILYDSYKYYGNKYGFKIAAGVHVPLEGWGPFFHYDKKDVAKLSFHIHKSHRQRPEDGVMVWHLLRKETFRNNNKMSKFWRKIIYYFTNESRTNGYEFLNIADLIFKGQEVDEALKNTKNYSTIPFISISKLKKESIRKRWNKFDYYEKNDTILYHGRKWVSKSYSYHNNPIDNQLNCWMLILK